MVLKLPPDHDDTEYVLSFELRQREGGFYSGRTDGQTDRHTEPPSTQNSTTEQYTQYTTQYTQYTEFFNTPNKKKHNIIILKK